MKLQDSSFITDENIHPDLVVYLRSNGFNVQTVYELNLTGKSDISILDRAYNSGRIIITHDSDFGTLAVTQGKPFHVIIYIRPAHIRGDDSIDIFSSLVSSDIDIKPGMIIATRRQEQIVKIRIREVAINL